MDPAETQKQSVEVKARLLAFRPKKSKGKAKPLASKAATSAGDDISGLPPAMMTSLVSL